MSNEFNAKKASLWLSKADELFRNHKTVLELKEKLINIGGKSSEISNEESNELESFLIGALNENMLNEDVHLKLVKLYLRTNKSSRLLRHLVKLEYGSGIGEYLGANWYKNTIDSIESTLNNTKSDAQIDRTLLISILALFISRYIKFQLKLTETNNNLIESLLK